MPKIIRISPYGAYANQMFQYMLARITMARVPNAELTGAYLPYWNVDTREQRRRTSLSIEINSHVLPFEQIVQMMNIVNDCELHLRCLSARICYYQTELKLCQSLFVPAPGLKTGYPSDTLVISIRLAETIQNNYPFYGPLPISWYMDLLNRSGLKPVFFGQIGDDAYSEALRKSFPDAEFVRSWSPMDDFNVLRTSVNICLSVSTFAWLAAWLSETASQIYMPLYLSFNQSDRRDIDLAPIGDFRYKFYLFRETRWNTTPDELIDLTVRPSGASEVSHDEVKTIFPFAGTEGSSLHPVVLVSD